MTSLVENKTAEGSRLRLRLRLKLRLRLRLRLRIRRFLDYGSHMR